ncbi:IQ calmodulin-binding motif family protein [Tritrichomonas foetus]|uniref:IQ calmodulin-binding motif family protein n=1 Tax=Tritrichomonas foetus TaxID=1144522 RepID=A0A1J4JE36_9EUKA|nr:IQ calmodulin-binding motif family protein [Tritrichomonas foetus]|eukprot:OHS95701.1 IQ calmodulin-binding motif family protein [Tritrichomonas foetus]
MIDPNFIHQRDVTNILTDLQKEVNKVKEKYAANPDDPNLAIELQQLIDNADRDLRLKTQAIVRSRLSQSRILPINYKPIPIPEVSPRAQSVAANHPPLPPLPPAPPGQQSTHSTHTSLHHTIQNSTGQNATMAQQLRRRNKSSNDTYNNHNSNDGASTIAQPIPPMVHEKPQRKTTTPVKQSRARRILPTKERLPQIDKHDPLAPPPPVNESMINTYGLQQLNEAGLIKNNDINQHLSGIVTVAPFVSDLPPVPLSMSPNYILDNNPDHLEMELKPKSPSIPPTPIADEAEDKIDEGDEYDEERSNEPKKRSFMLYNGEPDEDSIDFMTFKRMNSNIWEILEVFLSLLRKLCEERGIRKVAIDCHILLDLSQMDPDEVSSERLMRCFIGTYRTKKRSKKVGFGFIGKDADKKAAIVIQSIFRGFTARRLVRFIKKDSSAARTIQRWYRTNIDTLQFRTEMRKIKLDRQEQFEELQGATDGWIPTQPHVLLHIINSHLPTELGRIAALKNDQVTLIIFSRAPLPTIISDYLKSNVPVQEMLSFVVPRQRLPYTLPMEDVLASDKRLMERIEDIAKGKPIYVVPNSVRDALVEVAANMDAFLLSPMPSIVDGYDKIMKKREFLGKCCKNLFKASEEIHEREILCKELTNLSINNLKTQQWFIRTNTGTFGWIDTSDLLLLEKLKKNADVLTPADLEDQTFRDLLNQNISKDLNVITNTISTIDKNQFFEDLWQKGAIIEAAPQNVVSRPSVSFFIPPKGDAEITGTWENLFISEFEVFATIHPAFVVDQMKLKKHAMKYGNELVIGKFTGTCVMDFWASNHSNKDRITPDNISFTATQRALPQMLSESTCKLHFDVNTMKMGKYTYVQDRLVLPEEMPSNVFLRKCKMAGIKVDQNVFFLPDLQEEITIGMVAVANTPEELVNLVYETMCILSESVFDLKEDPSALLFSYCTAIEHLKSQVDTGYGIKNSVLMKKMKIKVVPDQIHPILYKFGKRITDSPGIAFNPPHSEEEAEMEAQDFANEVKIQNILSENEIPLRRSLLTTPTDAKGRERKLMTPSDDEDRVSKIEKEIQEEIDEQSKKERDDLPEGPAGADIPDGNLTNIENTKEEHKDNEIPPEAPTPADTPDQTFEQPAEPNNEQEKIDSNEEANNDKLAKENETSQPTE